MIVFEIKAKRKTERKAVADECLSRMIRTNSFSNLKCSEVIFTMGKCYLILDGDFSGKDCTVMSCKLGSVSLVHLSRTDQVSMLSKMFALDETKYIDLYQGHVKLLMQGKYNSAIQSLKSKRLEVYDKITSVGINVGFSLDDSKIIFNLYLKVERHTVSMLGSKMVVKSVINIKLD